ncbi:hypothetical protein [Marinigracilibium pacificum]|uniref:Lipoprotein n=1 Tax=Marinigracilibium pacificum TaxID=2729599 RepID=A0A848IZ11_9BACT|nr:hypothetical protein [Marinigracilibium pacificum]NMM47530.1 hypothetical protein [Marinigracilibium pacificum]
MIKRAAFLILTFLIFSCGKKSPVGDWEIPAIYDHDGLNEQVKNLTREDKLSIVKDIKVVDESLSETVIGKIIENNKKNLDKETIDNLVKAAYIDMYSVKTNNSFISIKEDNTFNYYIDPYYFEGTWEEKDENTIMLNIDNNDFYSSPIELKLIYENENYSFKNITHDATTLWVYDRVLALESSKLPKHRLPENNRWRNRDLDAKTKVKNLIKFWIYVFDDLIVNEEPLIKSSKYYLCPFRFYSIGLTVYSIDNEKIRPWKSTFKKEEEFNKAHELLVETLRKTEFPKEKGLGKLERNLKFFQAAYANI